MEIEKFRDDIDKHSSELETMGLTPMASRIFIYMMYVGDSEVTFDELVNYFQVSKSAISNGIKLLQSADMLSHKTYGGKRKRYFYSNTEMLFNLKGMTQRLKHFINIFEDVQKAHSANGSYSKELDNYILFYKMMLAELPIIMQRWQNTVKQKNN